VKLLPLIKARDYGNTDGKGTSKMFITEVRLKTEERLGRCKIAFRDIVIEIVLD
jgi:hypothetical protein